MMVMKIAPDITSGQNLDARSPIAQAIAFDLFISPQY